MRETAKNARAGDRTTGEKESIGIPLYGYANDGRQRGRKGEKSEVDTRERDGESGGG